MDRTVTVVNVADVEAIEQSIGRAGRIVAKTFPLDTGVPHVAMELTWTWLSKGYGTPRHRHCFDQIRFVLKGEFGAGTGDIDEGQCAYFPEGTHYGPQHQEDECEALILQFQGPSGVEYLTHFQLDDARQELIAAGGSFTDGVYTRVTADGRKINMDSHKACWEHVTGRTLDFPEGRFRQPVIMLPEHYRWLPDPKLAGVERKHLGTFSEVRTGVSFLRLAPGSRIPAARQEEAEIRYLVEGAAQYGGKTWHGGKTRDRGTYFFLPHGAPVGEIATDVGATFFIISLPLIAEAERELAASARAAQPTRAAAAHAGAK